MLIFKGPEEMIPIKLITIRRILSKTFMLPIDDVVFFFDETADIVIKLTVICAILLRHLVGK